MAGVTDFEDADSTFSQRDEYILTSRNFPSQYTTPCADANQGMPHKYFDIRFETTDDVLIGFAEKWRDETVTLWNEGQPDQTPTTGLRIDDDAEIRNPHFIEG